MVGSTKFEATASGICTSCELDESQDSPFVRKDFFQIFEDPDRPPACPVAWLDEPRPGGHHQPQVLAASDGLSPAALQADLGQAINVDVTGCQ